MIKTLATFAIGYAAYHIANTEQGQQMAKDVLKSALHASGKAEDALTRAVFKALTMKPETDAAHEIAAHSAVAHDQTIKAQSDEHPHKAHPVGTCELLAARCEFHEEAPEDIITVAEPDHTMEVTPHG